MGLSHGLALAGKCSCCWHFHSHLLSPGLSEAQTQQIFLTRCRLPVFSTDIATADTKTEHSGRLPMKGFTNCQSHRETTTCCSTALLWLLTHPVNLPVWLVLCKMRALSAFPQVKAAMITYCIVKYC